MMGLDFYTQLVFINLNIMFDTVDFIDCYRTEIINYDLDETQLKNPRHKVN